MSSPYDPHPIDYSIAYSDVCFWANNKSRFNRPRPEILDKALKHAQFLEDFYIIQKIREAYTIWQNVSETPTPTSESAYLPPPTPEALEMQEELTKCFRIFRRPSCNAMVFDDDEDRKQKTQTYSPLMDETK